LYSTQVITYSTMLMPTQPQQQPPQGQVGMVAAAGTSQPMPAVSAQPPSLVTTMAQPTYFVSPTNSAPHPAGSSYNGHQFVYVSATLLLKTKL
jgi:hypothetical protein